MAIKNMQDQEILILQVRVFVFPIHARMVVHALHGVNNSLVLVPSDSRAQPVKKVSVIYIHIYS